MSTLEEAPVEPHHRDRMNELATALQMFFNPDGVQKVCFTLLVTDFDEFDGPEMKDGRMNYISNGSRENIMTLFKELYTKYEADTGTILPTPQ